MGSMQTVTRNEGIPVCSSDLNTSHETTSDTLASVLLSAVRDFGLPDDVAIRLARGDSVDQIALQGHARSQVLALLGSLSVKMRNRVVARERKRRFNAGVPVKSELAKFNNVDRRRRSAETFFKKRGMTRSEFGRQEPGLCRWLLTYDREWLEARFPRINQHGVKVTDQRARVLSIARRLAPGLVVRTRGPHTRRAATREERQLRRRLRAENGRLYVWMLNRDKAWFSAVVPGVRQFTPPRNLQEARRQLAEALAEGISSRTRLKETRKKVYEWLTQHAAGDLDSAFGYARKAAPKDVSQARRRLNALLSDGIDSRKMLIRSDYTLYQWLLRNAPALLDRKLPRKRRPNNVSDQRHRVIVILQKKVFELVRAGATEASPLKQIHQSVRRFIRAEENSLYQWMREKDADWFNAIVPSRRLSAPRNRQEALGRLAAAVKGGITCRSGLKASEHSLWRWLSEHDPDALDCAFG
jgi:hypothetical protein